MVIRYNSLYWLNYFCDFTAKYQRTRASVFKTLCPQHMLAPNTNLENNMYAPIDNASLIWYFKSTKNRRNLFNIQSVYLHTIPNQLSKLQAPSLNSFRDILLTSLNLKCPNKERAMEIFDEFVLKLIRKSTNQPLSADQVSSP